MSYDLFVNNLEDLIARAERGELGDNDIEVGRNSFSIPTSSSQINIITPNAPSSSRDDNYATDSPMPSDYSIQSSTFAILSGSAEYLLRDYVLTYLQCQEISKLESTSRYFRHLCSQPSLWNTIYKRDFNPFDDYDFSSQSFTRNIILHNRVNTNTKALYQSRYCDYKSKISRNKEEAKQLERDVRRSLVVGKIERLLDFSQVRICGPLLISSLFLSIVLFCQKVDGLNIPYWSCAAPLAVSIWYVVASLCLLNYIADREYKTDSLFKSLWSYIKGPIVAIYKDVLNESRVMVRLTFFVLLCLLVQLGLLVVKLSLYIPASFRNHLSWGIVFIPVWIFFVLFLVIQCTDYRMEPIVFFNTLFLLWIPFVIIFSCLTIKLEFDNDGKGDIRVSYMLIPFFLYEAFFLIWSAVYFFVSFVRYRRGFLERIGDAATLFFLCWATLSPLVTFQALLCARDDSQLQHKGNRPTATEVVSPILVMIGLLFFFATIFSSIYKTPFQGRRAEALNESAGLRAIYRF